MTQDHAGRHGHFGSGRANGDLAQARAVLFDKDGTLFAFERGEGEIGQRLIHELSHGDRGLSRALAETAGYDAVEGKYAPDSLIASGSWALLAKRWAQDLPLWRADELEAWLRLEAVSLSRLARAPAAADLKTLLRRLCRAGLRLGLATHDVEASARRQLERAHIAELFPFVAGYGSGFAPKPDPSMLQGFCASVGVEAGDVVVVGDSVADLAMARAGGALAGIGVLSGPADADILAPEADLILPSIADLPAALGV